MRWLIGIFLAILAISAVWVDAAVIGLRSQVAINSERLDNIEARLGVTGGPPISIETDSRITALERARQYQERRIDRLEQIQDVMTNRN